ncbi:MAG: 50S ribosomal protein L15 [Candidatus Delongbacteria bacterium]|nr:50S ribosomal protein L15 [Candidatus Delongbacteria bacterium]
MLDKLKTFEGRKYRHRIGRGDGSGWGHTAGRGHKGAKSRSGYSSQAQFEGGQMPISRRFPKRGFKNIFKTVFQVVNLSDLEQYFQPNDTVTFEKLLESRLIRKSDRPVKILGTGEIQKALIIQAHAFSKSAVEKIQKAGGTIEEV